MSSAIFETHFPSLPAPKRGKVRDMYDLGDAMLMVASDRLSAFDVVMPNPARAGGISEVLKIAHLAQAFHVAVSPHGVGSGINIAAALQLAAVMPNFTIYEYNQLLNPLRHGLLDTEMRFVDGALLVPEGPGLGVRLNEDAVRRYALS